MLKKTITIDWKKSKKTLILNKKYTNVSHIYYKRFRSPTNYTIMSKDATEVPPNTLFRYLSIKKKAMSK